MYLYCALLGCPILAFFAFRYWKDYMKTYVGDICFVTFMFIGIVLCIVFLLSEYPMI